MDFNAINYGDSVLLVGARHMSSPILKIAPLVDHKKCVLLIKLIIITVYNFNRFDCEFWWSENHRRW